jgi:DNA-binding HxlR family transcriptional regulator
VIKLSVMDSKSVSEKDIPPCGCEIPGALAASTCYCGVEDLLRVIRRRYSLAVLNAIQQLGRARYHEIANALPNASSSTMAETLHALERSMLVVRRDLTQDAAPHTTYEVIESGLKLLSRLRPLLDEVTPPPPHFG